MRRRFKDFETPLFFGKNYSRTSTERIPKKSERFSIEIILLYKYNVIKWNNLDSTRRGDKNYEITCTRQELLSYDQGVEGF